jgi:SAM-dependent methyltransferase
MQTLKQRLNNYRRLMRLSDPEHLEAPDRHFIGHRDIITRNLARYQLVAPHVRGTLADVGCGRGYGLEALRGRYQTGIGLDLSREFLADLRADQPETPIVLASGDRLPLADQSIDTLISFEVIEHVNDDEAFLWNLRRVLRPGGLLAISTPNRVAASGDAERPLNKFHVREYAPEEFRALLARVFEDVELYGQSEHAGDGESSSFVDRIPVAWKYRVPIHIQGIISIMVRPPLRLDECRFSREALAKAHTLLALCQMPGA